MTSALSDKAMEIKWEGLIFVDSVLNSAVPFGLTMIEATEATRC